jgi:hypothetical protein
MKIQLSEMYIEHREAVFALWTTTEGIGLSGADSREAITTYLERLELRLKSTMKPPGREIIQALPPRYKIQRFELTTQCPNIAIVIDQFLGRLRTPTALFVNV